MVECILVMYVLNLPVDRDSFLVIELRELFPNETKLPINLLSK